MMTTGSDCEQQVLNWACGELGFVLGAEAVFISELRADAHVHPVATWSSHPACWASQFDAWPLVDDELPVETIVVGSATVPARTGEPSDLGSAGAFPMRLDAASYRWSSAVMDADRSDVAVIAPMMSGTRSVGFLCVVLRGEDGAGPEARVALSSAASLLVQFRARMDAERDVQDQIRFATRLRETSELLAAAGGVDAPKVVLQALATVGDLLDARVVGALQFSDEAKTVTLKHRWRAGQEEPPVPIGAMRSEDVSWLGLADRPLPDKIVARLESEVVDWACGVGLMPNALGNTECAWWTVPMIIDGRRIGLMVIATEAERTITDWEAAGLRNFAMLLPAFEKRCAAEEQLGAAFYRSPIGVVLRGPSGELIDCNDAYRTFLGYESRAALIDTKIEDILDVAHPAAPPNLLALLQSEVADVEVPFRHRCGRTVWGRLTLSRVTHTLGVAYLSHVIDVTDQRAERTTLQRQAFFDELTGLPNRHSLAEYLTSHHGSREGGRTSHAGGSALLMIDLDGFKQVNDHHGHQFGDEVLKAVASRLQRCVRPGDLAFRYGGDEFVILLNGPITEEAALGAAEHIHRPFDQPVVVAGIEIDVSFSAGVTLVVDGLAEGYQRALARADEAMYQAKHAQAGSTRLSVR